MGEINPKNEGYHYKPGNSAIATFFGMVKTWPFGKVVGDLQRLGIKLGHGLNHLAVM